MSLIPPRDAHDAPQSLLTATKQRGLFKSTVAWMAGPTITLLLWAFLWTDFTTAETRGLVGLLALFITGLVVGCMWAELRWRVWVSDFNSVEVRPWPTSSPVTNKSP